MFTTWCPSLGLHSSKRGTLVTTPGREIKGCQGKMAPSCCYASWTLELPFCSHSIQPRDITRAATAMVHRHAQLWSSHLGACCSLLSS
jgi:hypothetical protein